jgi:L-alanine-DL-glutamate epimerase-like enolase superfamily enzyme
VAAFLDQVSCQLAWIEEPLPPWQLCEVNTMKLPAPLAAGEHCYGPHEIPLFEVAGVNVWQPDAVFCGGFLNFMRICQRAKALNARLVPHGGGLLPALHAAACGAGIEQMEWHLLLEPKRQAHFPEITGPDKEHRIAVPVRSGWAGPLDIDLLD